MTVTHLIFPDGSALPITLQRRCISWLLYYKQYACYLLSKLASVNISLYPSSKFSQTLNLIIFRLFKMKYCIYKIPSPCLCLSISPPLTSLPLEIHSNVSQAFFVFRKRQVLFHLRSLHSSSSGTTSFIWLCCYLAHQSQLDIHLLSLLFWATALAQNILSKLPCSRNVLKYMFWIVSLLFFNYCGFMI